MAEEVEGDALAGQQRPGGTPEVEDRISGMAPGRFALSLAAVFALLAVSSALVGLYALTAFSVAARRPAGVRSRSPGRP